MQALDRFFTPRPGWIFNPVLDVICFVVPILIAVIYIEVKLTEPTLMMFALDAGHVFATAIPLLFFADKSNPMFKKCWIKPLIVVISLQVLCFYSLNSFAVILGYYAIFHIMSQLYGWLAILNKSEASRSQFDKRLDKLFFLFLGLAPLVFWHTEASTINKGYFYQGNLILKVSPIIWQITNVLFIICAATWLIRFIQLTLVKNQAIIGGKLLFFSSVFVMFYGGIVIYGNRNFFWRVFVINHGIAYLVHILINSKRKSQGVQYDLFPLGYTSVALYFGTIAVFGYGWYASLRYFGVMHPYAVLLWTPLIIHYAYDALLWKKNALRA